MSNLIDRDALMNFAQNNIYGTVDCNDIARFPTVDAIPRGAFEQIRWERDTAIGQLEIIGKSLGEKMDDVEPVRHGYWIFKKTAIGAEYTICSECKTDFKFKTDKGTFARLDMRGMPGCPNCRAKMDKEEQDA